MRSIRDPDTGELRDSLSRDWTAYLDELNVTSVLVANGLEDPSTRLSAIDPDVLMLTNGEDVGAHPPRDRTERALVEAAIEANVPVFGVCRGHQFLNQYYGGNVVELADKLSTDHNHDGTSHEVDILDGPPAAVLPDRIAVNSYHNDGVTTSHIAPPLKPFAISDDGVVRTLPPRAAGHLDSVASGTSAGGACSDRQTDFSLVRRVQKWIRTLRGFASRPAKGRGSGRSRIINRRRWCLSPTRRSSTGSPIRHDMSASRSL